MKNIMSIGEELKKSVIGNALFRQSLAQLNGMKALLPSRQFARFGFVYGIKKKHVSPLRDRGVQLWKFLTPLKFHDYQIQG